MQEFISFFFTDGRELTEAPETLVIIVL
jgi:hypothetical protein